MVGDDYYAFGETWVDITCIKCAHSKDISVRELDSLLAKLKKTVKRRDRGADQKTNTE